MANDLETRSIDAAFAAAIDKGFVALHTAYIAAGGDETQHAQADKKFKTALTLARLVRERALKQL